MSRSWIEHLLIRRKLEILGSFQDRQFRMAVYWKETPIILKTTSQQIPYTVDVPLLKKETQNVVIDVGK